MKPFLFFALIFSAVVSASAAGMTKSDYPGIIIYHEGEDLRTLEEINRLLEVQQEKTQDFFGMPIPKRSLFVYKNQKEMQRQKHPFVTLFVGPDWYIGDNIKDRALIVSPNTEVNGHSYQSILGAIPHEYVHTVVYSLNPKCPLWLNEGVALYLSNGHPVSVRESVIPPVKIFTSGNSLYFAKHNGYAYADKFIEFLEHGYGRSKVMELIHNPDYKKVLGKTIDDLYPEWVAFVSARYP